MDRAHPGKRPRAGSSGGAGWGSGFRPGQQGRSSWTVSRWRALGFPSWERLPHQPHSKRRCRGLQSAGGGRLREVQGRAQETVSPARSASAARPVARAAARRRPRSGWSRSGSAGAGRATRGEPAQGQGRPRRRWGFVAEVQFQQGRPGGAPARQGRRPWGADVVVAQVPGSAGAPQVRPSRPGAATPRVADAVGSQLQPDQAGQVGTAEQRHRPNRCPSSHRSGLSAVSRVRLGASRPGPAGRPRGR